MTYGPARGPHAHPVDIRNLQKKESITRLGSAVPQASDSGSGIVSFQLESREVVSRLADGVDYVFWTFGGTVPGPMMRARVGQTVRIRLRNHVSSTHSHSLDLHALTGPGGGAAQSQTKPGEETTLEFRPDHPGVYVYHCGTENVPSHIANGMYGLIVIDPASGWEPVDREFYVMQGEFYTAGSLGAPGLQPFSPEKLMAERPVYIVWNGAVRSLAGANALSAKQGETIRLFVGNAGISRSLNFHVIGEIFDRVYVEGGMQTREGIQTTLIPAGGAAAVVMKLEVPGDYVLVDHALSRIERGAWAQLKVAGPQPAPE
jgi:nitrite reductase (NO-forming)